VSRGIDRYRALELGQLHPCNLLSSPVFGFSRTLVDQGPPTEAVAPVLQGVPGRPGPERQRRQRECRRTQRPGNLTVRMRVTVHADVKLASLPLSPHRGTAIRYWRRGRRPVDGSETGTIMTFSHELNQNVHAVLKIMSQRELAKRAGVQQAAISRLLSTDSEQHGLPGFKTAERLNEWCKRHLGRGPMNQIVGADERW
jgi:hypothetical protein